MNKNNIYLKTFLAFVIWSFLGPLLNKSSFTAFQSSFFFGITTSLSFLVILLYKKNLSSLRKIRLSRSLILFSLVSGIAGTIWLKSLTLIPVAQALFLLSSVPLIALLIEVVVFKHKPKKLELAALFSGIIGILILLSNGLSFNTGSIISIGSLMVVIAASLFAFQGFLIKELGCKYSCEIINFIALGSQAIVSFLFIFNSTFHFTTNSVLATTLWGIFASVIAYYLYFDSLKALRVSTVRLIGYIEPFLGSIWGIVFLSQALSSTIIAGGILIILASYLITKA